MAVSVNPVLVPGPAEILTVVPVLLARIGPVVTVPITVAVIARNVDPVLRAVMIALPVRAATVVPVPQVVPVVIVLSVLWERTVRARLFLRAVMKCRRPVPKMGATVTAAAVVVKVSPLGRPVMDRCKLALCGWISPQPGVLETRTRSRRLLPRGEPAVRPHPARSLSWMRK